MNRNINLLLGLAFFITATLCASATAFGHVYSMESNSPQVRDENSPTGCSQIGGNCEPIVACETSVVSSPDGSSWIVSGNISSASWSTPSGSGSVSGANYTFSAGMVAHVQSGDFANVPAMDIDFAGHTTDGSGNFSFSIPK